MNTGNFWSYRTMQSDEKKSEAFLTMLDIIKARSVAEKRRWEEQEYDYLEDR